MRAYAAYDMLENHEMPQNRTFSFPVLLPYQNCSDIFFEMPHFPIFQPPPLHIFIKMTIFFKMAHKIFQNIGQNLNCGQKEAFLFMSQCAATKGL